MSEREFCYRTVDTPVGKFWIVVRDDLIWSAEFEPRWAELAAKLEVITGEAIEPGARGGRSPVLTDACRRVRAYFAGDLGSISAAPLALEGTAFQKRIWNTVRRITAGRTVTYGELAKRARNVGAFRAAGAANGANPCALFVPCHRVVSSSGRLTGYGGGIRAKAFLLEHEGVSTEDDRIVR